MGSVCRAESGASEAVNHGVCFAYSGGEARKGEPFTNGQYRMNRSATNGGNGKGHFAKGNKGRPVGTRHKSTVNLLEIRRRIAASWEACNGDQLLRDIAESDPLGYLKLVVALMPKIIDATIDVGKLEIVVKTEAGALFAGRAAALHALNGKLGPAQILEAFRQAKRDEMELAKQENTQ